MDSALTVMIVFGVVAIAAAGGLALASWSRRTRPFASPAVVRRRRDVIEHPEAPLPGDLPARRTVEEERVRRTTQERAAPPGATYARDDFDDPMRRPPM